MARKTKLVTIKDEGRDKGKGYLITEMPAHQGEKWAARLLLAAANAGLEMPEGFSLETASMAKLAGIAMLAISRSKWDAIEPLLDEMMQCVQYVPNPANTTVVLSLGVTSDSIEEVKTYLTIRKEWIALHLGFSMADASQNSGAEASQ